MAKKKEVEPAKMEMSVEYRHELSMAHRLMNHPGACRFLHGHNYVLTYHIIAMGFDYAGTGMICDFKLLKGSIGKLADQLFDHKTLLQNGDPLVDLLRPILGQDAVRTMPYPPTAENMAGMLLAQSNTLLRELCDDVNKENGNPFATMNKILVLKLTVEETPGNAAVVRYEV